MTFLSFSIHPVCENFQIISLKFFDNSFFLKKILSCIQQTAHVASGVKRLFFLIRKRKETKKEEKKVKEKRLR